MANFNLKTNIPESEIQKMTKGVFSFQFKGEYNTFSQQASLDNIKEFSATFFGSDNGSSTGGTTTVLRTSGQLFP